MSGELGDAFERATAARWGDSWAAYGLDLEEVNDFVGRLVDAMFDPDKRRIPGDHWDMLDELDEEIRERILDDLYNLAALSLTTGIEYGHRPRRRWVRERGSE
jgi:hypothetical protein